MEINSDQLSIDTPELVSIEMELAGIGSRFIALLVDYLIWTAAMTLLGVLLFVVLPGVELFSRISGQWAVALAIFAVFVLNWGYFTLFEAFWNGRTPGKRVARIRVIQRSGRAIGFFESLARNLVRYVDQLPFFYGVGVICMFINRQHLRLGDLAAGTLVVRDRDEEAPAWGELGSRTFTQTPAGEVAPEPQMGLALPAMAVAKLEPSDLEVMEAFFARRLDLELATRQALAWRLAGAIRAKSGLEIPAGASVETFLEATARQLRDVARLRQS